MFIGRERELELLESAYSSDRFQMVVVYGRRRVGKTALLNKFISDKPHAALLTAQQTVAQENLERLSDALTVMDHGAEESKPRPDALATGGEQTYRSFSAALSHAFSSSVGERRVLVIDEYPYLAESHRGISSLLQTLIDRLKADSKLMLILCGSSMSFMEHQVLAEKSPLYGRRTAQIKLQPFDVFEAARMLGNPDPRKVVELYGIVGGIPLYLEQLDATRSVEWNIAHRILKTGTFLIAEPENFMLQELRAPSKYNAVLSSIARGCVRPQEIADAIGASASLVQQYLARLEELSIIKRIRPVTSKKKRQVRYAICDNLFRFYYTFAIKYATSIEAGMSDAVARRIVREELSTYMGGVFEDVCRQWVLRKAASGELDMLPQAVGTWWSTNPHERREEEIDVVAQDVDGNLLVGECEWNNAPVDASIIGVLRRRASLLQDGAGARLALFSRSGFEDECREVAHAESILLVDLDELFD
jgi:AAA+ ATPase superfamily predicted ATPase